MYEIAQISKAKLDFIQSDENLKELYESIKIISDNFTTFDEDAFEYEKIILEAIAKDYKETKKPRPTKKPATTKPKKPSAVKKPSSPQKPSTQSKPKTENAKTQDVSKIVSELFAAIQEQQSNTVSEEQVQTIVENVVASRKICYDDLCNDLIKAIDETQKVKVYLPNMRQSESFTNDIPNLLKIIDDVILGNNVMLIGGAGTGKTFLAEKVASVLKLETEVINANQFTSPIEIIGGQTIEGYQEGKLIRAWSQGKLLIIDEMPKLDPNTAGLLNEALAKTNLSVENDRAVLNNSRGDRFTKAQGFGVIATGNVYPNTTSNAYGANNKQDISLLDRFTGSVYEVEKNPEFEKKVILPGYLMLWNIADVWRTLIETNQWESQVSIRFMETSLRVYQAEMKAIEDGADMSNRKTYKDVIDSFLFTFSDVQQKEIKQVLNYDQLFSKHQYRNKPIDKKVI